MTKKVIALLSFVLCVVVANAQDQGIGLRLGDPTSVTYKKYFNNSKAFEFLLGTSGAGWHYNYYRNTFDDLNEYEGLRYRSHRVKSTLYLQGRYLLHNDIYVQGLEGKWDWYWGLGAMLKIANVEYRFHDDNSSVNNKDTYNDFDLGPEGIIGMEYTFEGVPITVFGEVSLMLEIVDRISIRPFSGAGVRYNF